MTSIDIESNPGGGVNFRADGGQSVDFASPELGRKQLDFSDISVLKIRPGGSGADLHEYDNIFLTAVPTSIPPMTIDFTSGVFDGVGNYLQDGFFIEPEGTDFNRCPDSLCFRQGIGVPTPNEVTMTRADLNLFDVFTIDVRRNPGGLTFFGDADQVNLPANQIGRIQLGFSDIAVFKITSGGSGVQYHDLDNITTVPEPGTALLLGLALAGLAVIRRSAG